MDFNNINRWRARLAMGAEIIDYYRIVPRACLIGYGWLLYKVVMWFMGLPAPSVEHAALVTTIIGAAAAVIGLYQSTGTKWSDYRFEPWQPQKDKFNRVKPRQENHAVNSNHQMLENDSPEQSGYDQNQHGYDQHGYDQNQWDRERDEL